ncbi:MAG: hypothetical protein LUI87_17290 [Lachnospiraceae bacterium]|nr:hypothetical protein [Lachnospiraceae bacterium]
MANKLRTFSNVLFTALFGLVLIQLFLYTLETYPPAIALIIMLLILLPLLPALRKAFPDILRKHSSDSHQDYRHHERRSHTFPIWAVWVLIQLPGILVLAAAFLTNKLEPSWDWGHTINIAYQIATSGTTSLPSYIAAYANNRFWIMVLTYFFKIILRVYPAASADTLKIMLWIVSDLLAVTAVNLIYLTAECYFSRKKAFFIGALAALYLPIYLYGQISYTDIPGMFLCALLLFLYSRLRLSVSAKQTYLCLALSGATAAAAYKLKVLVFIPVLAIFIEETLRMLSSGFYSDSIKISVQKSLDAEPPVQKRPDSGSMAASPVNSADCQSGGFPERKIKACLLHTLAALCSFAIVFAASNLLIERALAVSDEMIEEYEIPLTHWVMMGLKGNGGYNSDDYAFTTGISGYQEKVDATVSEIKERLSNLGAKGLLKHIFYNKLRRTWCKCMLSADDYISDSTLAESSLFQKLFYKNGSLSRPIHILVSVYYFILMLGVFASGIFSFGSLRSEKPGRSAKAESSLTFICRTTLVGFFIFESIWECNSRYLLCLMPVFIITAGDGLSRILLVWKTLCKKSHSN